MFQFAPLCITRPRHRPNQHPDKTQHRHRWGSENGTEPTIERAEKSRAACVTNLKRYSSDARKFICFHSIRIYNYIVNTSIYGGSCSQHSPNELVAWCSCTQHAHIWGIGADSVYARKTGKKARQRKKCFALIVSNFLSHSFHCFIINQFIVRGYAGSERTQWFSGCAYYFYGQHPKCPAQLKALLRYNCILQLYSLVISGNRLCADSHAGTRSKINVRYRLCVTIAQASD